MTDRARPTPSRFTYAGLFFCTLAALMHQILLTRIFSVTMWYHFAFMAISVAMFGMTVGAIVVFLAPKILKSTTVDRALTGSALGYAVSLVVGFLVYLQIPFIGDSSVKSIVFLTISYIVIAIPFVWSGVTVALVLSTYQKDVGSLYAADLIGAAIGCVLLVFTLNLTDAPSAILVVGAFAAFGALLFALGDPDKTFRGHAGLLTAALAAGAVAHTLLTNAGNPLIRILDTAQNINTAYHYERWNSHSRVTVSGNPMEPSNAAGWGLSEKTGATNAKVKQLGMGIDTWAGTVITNFDGDTSKLFYLKDDVTNIAHFLRPKSDVFVIGVGGGRDVLSALVFDQKSVTGVEVNKDVLRATTERFGEFAGHLDRNPKVTLAVDEARSYLTRQARTFDIVQISLIDTWAATAAGAFVLTENALYTVEAWVNFLEHLTPRGVLSVSRWYYPTRPGETIRTASLARAALVKIGVADPASHVLMVKAPRAVGLPGALGNGISTILVGREPFTEADIAALEGETARLGFDLMVTPTRTEAPVYRTILHGENLQAFYDSYSLDVTAPTDDRPFFFQMLRLRDVLKGLGESWLDPNRANLEAIRLLAVLLVIVSVLTVLCIVLPLVLASRAKAVLKGQSPLLGYFLCIGLGFMFIEVSLMQRLMLLLGKPTYALSVVLFTLLVGTGLGSLSSERITARLAPRTALFVLLGVLGLIGLALPALVGTLDASPTPVRIAASALVLLPMGFVMGLPFPLGLRAAQGSPDLVPWLWGVNGAASVLCSVLAMVVALGAGISASFWTGVACYVGALLTYVVATRQAVPSRASG